MSINLNNKDKLDLYIIDNIEGINSKINDFKIKNCPKAIFDETDIKKYLKDKLYTSTEEQKEDLINMFELFDFKSSKITEIANELIYYKPDLVSFYQRIVLGKLISSYSPEMCSNVLTSIYENSTLTKEESSFINSFLNKITKKSLYMILQGGFINNISNVESGVMTANAGDSAQFLFVSRAILAGYNCSNVDVRSSRYDAIVDFKGKLFKVQVKGINDTVISFKDRDRGGKGIDSHNERNKGKRITSRDCDIYVAVDKQIGTCYIIPMHVIDPLPDSKIKRMSVKELEIYRENWMVINELYEK